MSFASFYQLIFYPIFLFGCVFSIYYLFEYQSIKKKIKTDHASVWKDLGEASEYGHFHKLFLLGKVDPASSTISIELQRRILRMRLFYYLNSSLIFFLIMLGVFGSIQRG